MFENMARVSVVQRSHYVTSDDKTVLSAVLGSCVAVCAFDETMGIGGMNHMLLPDARESSQSANSKLYGANLMELLLNELYKKARADNISSSNCSAAENWPIMVLMPESATSNSLPNLSKMKN
jgi:chemotaxis receptor (MCP) glutamine deamidase CheD